jgi:histone H3/H4
MSHFLVVRQIISRKGEIKMAGFASARIEKLIRTAGAHRVSAGAITRLNEILTDYGKNLAKYSVEIARHSGRKTVKENDIKLAAAK